MRTRARFLVGLTLVLVAAGAAAAAWFYWPREAQAPDPQEQEPEQIARYLASDDFAALPPERRQAYVDKLASQFEEGRGFRGSMRDPDLTEEEMEKIRKNAAPHFRAYMKKRLDDYFAMTPEEKTAVLDKFIDRMQEGRKQWEKRRAEQAKSGDGGDGGGPPWARKGRRGSGFSLDRLRKRIEGTDVQTRARMVQFMLDFRARMLKRGIEFRPPGPPADKKE